MRQRGFETRKGGDGQNGIANAEEYPGKGGVVPGEFEEEDGSDLLSPEVVTGAVVGGGAEGGDEDGSEEGVVDEIRAGQGTGCSEFQGTGIAGVGGIEAGAVVVDTNSCVVVAAVVVAGGSGDD